MGAHEEELVSKVEAFTLSGDPLSTSTAELFVSAFAPIDIDSSASSKSPLSSVSRSAQRAQSSALVALATRSTSSLLRPAPASSSSATPPQINDEDLPSLLTPVIRSKLADTSPASLVSALAFLSALFKVSHVDAHQILAADGILDLALEAHDACNPTSKDPFQQHYQKFRVALALADLLSSAANHTQPRKWLSQQQAALDWLDIHAAAHTDSVADTQQSRWPHASKAVAVLAGLADLKLSRALAQQEHEDLTASLTGSTSSPSQPTSREQHLQQIAQRKTQQARKDRALFDTVRSEALLLLPIASTASLDKPRSGSDNQDVRRLVQLACLEALTWLTVQPAFRAALAADATLLKSICSSFAFSNTPGSNNHKHETDTNTITITDIDLNRADGALQLSLATILSNVCEYRPALTDEQRQVKRLRNFASASAPSSSSSSASKDEEENEKLESDDAVDSRCAAVLDAGGVETLAAIAACGRSNAASASASASSSSSSGAGPGVIVNQSKPVRDAVSTALLSIVTKQDRHQRGKFVQRGGYRALLVLSQPVLAAVAASVDVGASKTAGAAGLFSRSRGSDAVSKVEERELRTLQAVARLVISINPVLLFAPSSSSASSTASSSSTGSLPLTAILGTLYLHESATTLMRFEALLALTNLASVGPDVAGQIAVFSIRAIQDPSLLKPALQDPAQDADRKGKKDETLLAMICEQLVSIDHPMVRRATVELLVNLLQVESTWVAFTSPGSWEKEVVVEMEDETCDQSKSKSKPEFVAESKSQSLEAERTTSRFDLRLKILVSLCDVDDTAYRMLGRGSSLSEPKPKSGSESGSKASDEQDTEAGTGVEKGQEASLSTRLASLAVLAMTSEAASVAQVLVNMSNAWRILRQGLEVDRCSDPLRRGWESADLTSSTASASSSSSASRVKKEENGLNISLRSAYVLANLVQYLLQQQQEQQEGKEPKAAIFKEQRGTLKSTVQDTIRFHVGELKGASSGGNSDPNDGVTTTRHALVQVLVEVLKLLDQI